MKKIILSGGGTGGHIYPAVAVAEALKRRFGGDVELLFVGAEGKMEMENMIIGMFTMAILILLSIIISRQADGQGSI